LPNPLLPGEDIYWKIGPKMELLAVHFRQPG
jgi:hypothetical protein